MSIGTIALRHQQCTQKSIYPFSVPAATLTHVALVLPPS
jgi:hypothetical protein